MTNKPTIVFALNAGTGDEVLAKSVAYEPEDIDLAVLEVMQRTKGQSKNLVVVGPRGGTTILDRRARRALAASGRRKLRRS